MSGTAPEHPLRSRLPAVLDLPCDRRSARRARRFLAEVLTADVAQEVRDTAILLTCELVTNAVEHAESECVLRISLQLGGELRVEVTDRDRTSPRVRDRSVLREHGRGMDLVDALATAWGSTVTEAGKTVWFTLSLGVVGALR